MKETSCLAAVASKTKQSYATKSTGATMAVSLHRRPTMQQATAAAKYANPRTLLQLELSPFFLPQPQNVSIPSMYSNRPVSTAIADSKSASPTTDATASACTG